MAYLPILGDVLELRVVCQVTSPSPQVSENVFHAVVGAVTGGGVSQAAIAVWYDLLIAGAYKTIMAAAATYRGVMVQKIWPLPRVVAEYTIASAGAGLSSVPILPLQTAGLLRAKTNIAGRAFRGRQYLPFPSQNQQDVDGTPTNGVLANHVIIGGAIYSNQTVVAGIITTSLIPVIYHRANFGVPPAGAHTSTPVTAIQTQKVWATQRRRGQLGRPNPFSPI
jgi:hypothetical protein